MSSVNQLGGQVAAPPPNREQRRHPVDPTALDNRPTRRGIPGAMAFYGEVGVHMTPTRIKTASTEGELRRYVISGHIWFSDRDLWNWLQSLASGGAA